MTKLVIIKISIFQSESQSTQKLGIGITRSLGRESVQLWIRGGKQVIRDIVVRLASKASDIPGIGTSVQRFEKICLKPE